jgi:DNA-binding response OmpR family regulator
MHQVLIIDDDPRIASLVQRGLEENGYQVSLAYDGLSGLRLAAQNEYSLIITDIILPKVNGLDVCKELKQARPDTPVFMLTALGTTDDKVEGFDAGDFNFLQWRGAPGLGARIAWNQSTILRFDYAQSREGWQAFFGFGHIF